MVLFSLMSKVGPNALPPLRQDIITVTMPGIICTRSQLARYAGTDGLIVLKNNRASRNRNSRRSAFRILWECVKSICKEGGKLSDGVEPNENGSESESDEENLNATDEEDPYAVQEYYYTAYCRIAPRILHNIFPSYEVEEVSSAWSFNPFHGLLSLKEMLTHWYFKLELNPSIHVHCEAGRSAVGGTRDQRAFKREVARAVRYASRQPEKKHIVLFGCSRGAATCFYTSMKLPETLASHISLVIVEAPFDTLDNVIQRSCWFPSLGRWFYRNFCDYRGGEEQQRAYSYEPENVSIRCPVAFVYSVKDTRVPPPCTEALIHALNAALVPKVIPAVEVLVLSHSRHPCMAVQNEEDQQAYVNFVEMLYEKYCS